MGQALVVRSRNPSFQEFQAVYERAVFGAAQALQRHSVYPYVQQFLVLCVHEGIRDVGGHDAVNAIHGGDGRRILPGNPHGGFNEDIGRALAVVISVNRRLHI